MIAALIILGILCVLILLTIWIARWTYGIAFHSPDGKKYDAHSIPEDNEQYAPIRERMLQMVDALSKLPCERVSITSRDGLRLSARYYHTADGAPLDISFHGYRGHALRDFCGGAMLSLREGHNLLLIDQRAHGDSEGKTISFGILERFDALDWIDYARERFGKDLPILLYGISMGGATVLMTSGLPLPPNVKGIIADCPYSSPKDIIQKVARGMGYPPRLAFPFIALGARLFGHFNLGAATAAEAVKRSPVPILILHGDDDRFVPQTMSAVVADANPKMVTRHLFPGAGHGLCFMVDRERYDRLVHEFLQTLDLS